MTIRTCSICHTHAHPLEKRRTYGKREWVCIGQAACGRRALDNMRVAALAGTEKASELLYAPTREEGLKKATKRSE